MAQALPLYFALFYTTARLLSTRFLMMLKAFSPPASPWQTGAFSTVFKRFPAFSSVFDVSIEQSAQAPRPARLKSARFAPILQ